MSEPLLWVGAVACALAAASGLSGLGSIRARVGSLCCALVLAPALVLIDNWHSEKLESLAERPELLAVGLLAAAAVLYGAALLLRDRPHLLPPLLVAALPFRIPVDLGGGESNLLIPLYAVIAAGLLARLLVAISGREEQPPRPPRALRFVAPALAVVVVLYAVQSAYADDPSAAVQTVAFFLAPFAALYYLLATCRWDAAVLRSVVLVLVAQGILFGLVAAGQYVSGELFWNDKVIAGNEAHPYFRVNSLFWDPNILGRYLTITMIALAGLTGRVTRGSATSSGWAAAGLFVVLLLVLVATFSQTSLLALLGGLLVLLAARWGVAQGIAAGFLALAALAASVALFAGGGLGPGLDSGRSGLVEGGLEIAADHPIIGVGSGGFAAEFSDRFYKGVGYAVESHTQPVTVAAEQGAVGLAAYLALLLAGAVGLIALVRPRPAAPATGPPLAAVLCAAYLAMVIHSMGYGAFLADPLTWAILAIAAGALGQSAPRALPEPSGRAAGRG